tara:strand:+ start:569 stop:874 length:306 start_codon:yes stop_codon:yes gene_type:complete
MNNIELSAWGEKNDTDDLITYKVQAKLKGKRQLNSLMKEFSGWKQAGEGYDPNNEKTIILMMRTFENKKSWMKFANDLPFLVEEFNPRTGKKKVINGKRRK